MKPHKHAELIKAWADGAEIQELMYHPALSDYWSDCRGVLTWHPENVYRVKPKSININGVKVPEPLRSVERGDTIFYVSLIESHGVRAVVVREPSNYTDLVSRGLVHSTREAAYLHSAALLSFTQQKD